MAIRKESVGPEGPPTTAKPVGSGSSKAI
ncbi:DUF6053 domain-containing protein [Lysobacter enzymogenes]